MTWLAISGLVWVALALGLAVVMGRGIRQADQREHVATWTAEVDAYVRAAGQRPLATAAPSPRRPSS
ncbi:hypothetical protein [Blastococcus sp. TBT05-19]|uniref:hypothetical protein n=1 Tax=Blastococcus sp. TBT05-19 TaxID=2250581 RepID=UPI0011BEC03A|nr:hypothetical protein [Blastococcus sp. TBT05-19]